MCYVAFVLVDVDMDGGCYIMVVRGDGNGGVDELSGVDRIDRDWEGSGSAVVCVVNCGCSLWEFRC